jgi:hypothetical protein
VEEKVESSKSRNTPRQEKLRIDPERSKAGAFEGRRQNPNQAKIAFANFIKESRRKAPQSCHRTVRTS